MIEFKKLKKIDLYVYDLIKRYEKAGTKSELVEQLKKVDKEILKIQRQKPAAVKKIEEALEISEKARRNDNTSWRAGEIAGLREALKIIKGDNL